MGEEGTDLPLQALQRENDDLRARVAELERELEQARRPADDPSPEAAPPPEARAPRRGVARTVGNVVFYAAMALILVGALLTRATQSGAPVNIGGYSGMLVLSESMQEVIPKGSLIITKSVDPETLAVGDDISFLAGPSTSVTHRIVDIEPQADGTLAFRTQGVNNPTPDGALVHQSNVVGKVIFHSLTLGLVAKAVSENWPLLLFLLAVLTALEWTLRRILGGKKPGGRGKKNEEDPAGEPAATP